MVLWFKLLPGVWLWTGQTYPQRIKGTENYAETAKPLFKIEEADRTTDRGAVEVGVVSGSEIRKF